MTSLTSWNGLPNCRALFWIANFGRPSATEARDGDAPFSISEKSRFICSEVQLRLVVRLMEGFQYGNNTSGNERIELSRHGLFDI